MIARVSLDRTDSRGCILQDATEIWPGLSRWTLELFKSEHGSRRVTIDRKDYLLGDAIEMAEATDGGEDLAGLVPCGRRCLEMIWSPDRSLEELNQIAKLLRIEARLQPLRHQGKPG